jgi:hypothetical protein
LRYDTTDQASEQLLYFVLHDWMNDNKTWLFLSVLHKNVQQKKEGHADILQYRNKDKTR